MKLDDYFEKAAKDPAFRAKQITESTYSAKLCLWVGGGIILFGLAYMAYGALAHGRSADADMLLPGLAIIVIHEQQRTRAAALRAIDRLTPPA